jgi:hypothetical protein
MRTAASEGGVQSCKVARHSYITSNANNNYIQRSSLWALELFFHTKSLEGQSANIAEATQTLEKVMKEAKWNDPANAVILL